LSLTESLLHPDAGLAGLMALSEGERFDTPRRTSRNGYNVIEWTSGDLNYRAVSDLNDQELQEFAALMKQNTAK
jgi:anti-sigma factor RsiW